MPFRWFSSGLLGELTQYLGEFWLTLQYHPLASPISRMHTRNPFFRHVTAQSPAPALPLSPAAIPLPTPTPDELLDLH